MRDISDNQSEVVLLRVEAIEYINILKELQYFVKFIAFLIY